MGMNAADVYRRQSIETTSPGRLVVMLYDGAISFIGRAREDIAGKRIAEANNNIQKAERIITELMVTLDTSYEVGRNLEALYDYMKRRLIEANVKKDAGILDEVEGYLITLRDAWNEAVKMVGSTPGSTVGGINISG